jgi:hypothetical protein
MIRYIANYDAKLSKPMDLFNQIVAIEGVVPYLHNVSNGVIEVGIDPSNTNSIAKLEKLAKTA